MDLSAWLYMKTNILAPWIYCSNKRRASLGRQTLLLQPANVWTAAAKCLMSAPIFRLPLQKRSSFAISLQRSSLASQHTKFPRFSILRVAIWDISRVLAEFLGHANSAFGNGGLTALLQHCRPVSDNLQLQQNTRLLCGCALSNVVSCVAAKRVANKQNISLHVNIATVTFRCSRMWQSVFSFEKLNINNLNTHSFESSKEPTIVQLDKTAVFSGKKTKEWREVSQRGRARQAATRVCSHMENNGGGAWLTAPVRAGLFYFFCTNSTIPL